LNLSRLVHLDLDELDEGERIASELDDDDLEKRCWVQWYRSSLTSGERIFKDWRCGMCDIPVFLLEGEVEVIWTLLLEGDVDGDGDVEYTLMRLNST
jgi:hypothetical protein